jgi:hypothetical protein
MSGKAPDNKRQKTAVKSEYQVRITKPLPEQLLEIEGAVFYAKPLTIMT